MLYLATKIVSQRARRVTAASHYVEAKLHSILFLQGNAIHSPKNLGDASIGANQVCGSWKMWQLKERRQGPRQARQFI